MSKKSRHTKPYITSLTLRGDKATLTALRTDLHILALRRNRPVSELAAEALRAYVTSQRDLPPWLAKHDNNDHAQ